MNRIFQQVWIALPQEVRNKLAEVFDIVRTGATEIIDQTVKSDGYTNSDLEVITQEKMNAYIGSEETFMRAWEITLAKVHSELHPPVGVIGGSVKEEVVDTSGDKIIADILDNGFKTTVDPKNEVVETQIPWCSTCASLGGRHKKYCPKFK